MRGMGGSFSVSVSMADSLAVSFVFPSALVAVILGKEMVRSSWIETWVSQSQLILSGYTCPILTSQMSVVVGDSGGPPRLFALIYSELRLVYSLWAEQF